MIARLLLGDSTIDPFEHVFHLATLGVGQDALECISDFGLSQKELEVLKLIREGSTYLEIAESLHIALSTVQYHIKNIYSKLGVTSKISALQRVYG